jgi:hypothetical protein
MRRTAVVRVATFALAFVHTFPARNHITAFLGRPSFAEGWEGLGALAAVGLYGLPVAVQARMLAALWRRRRAVLRAAGLLLAMAHVVPASDHLPRFFESGRWYDAWRGLGSTLAVIWFLAPLPLQGRAIAALARFANIRRFPPVGERSGLFCSAKGPADS